MDRKLAINLFNCSKSNKQKNVFEMKCRALPKENRNENIEILKLMQVLKRL